MSKIKNALPQGGGANTMRSQRTNNPHPYKPNVMQPKAAQASQSNRQPVAPPVYRPQTVPKAVQPKVASAARPQAKQPAALPVYRPQPLPKVLQTKMAAQGQVAKPTAPPAYRAQATPRVLQTKASQSKSPEKSVMPPASSRTIQRTRDRRVIQLQVNSGIADKGSLTAGNWAAMLQTSALNTYLWKHAPSIKAGQGVNKDTYELIWTDAIEFNDGTKGDLHMHMHEGVLDIDHLAGGGAWVDGGAVNHGQNFGQITKLNKTCVAWINNKYESECYV
ncbi:MAG TPA: hypothetical protein VJ842_16445 [Pyrinomonadaceae bacterium]|nr:hypothetical protein [Pyrinomonadaceae bacterium]